MNARALWCVVPLLLAGCRLEEPPTVLISGAVVDTAGRPVGGALLVATRLHEEGKANAQTFAARSRADGKFELLHHAERGPMPTGRLVMSVSREGLTPIEMVVAVPAIMFTVELDEGR